MQQDRIYRDKTKKIEDFNFGKETTAVFDNMLLRSVPFYEETQRMIRELAIEFAMESSNIYDLGCSTANTFLMIGGAVPSSVRFVGVDSSAEMLAKAADKLSEAGLMKRCELIHQDLNSGFLIQNASVVIMNLTLQFIRPLFRERTIQNIAAGLNEGGCLILVEKVLSANSSLNRAFIKLYYDFKKRNGYTEMEIAKKREALENVLIPYHFEENKELLLKNGFKACDVFFRWYNFCGMVAIK